MKDKSFLFIFLVGLILIRCDATSEPTPEEIVEPRIREVFVEPTVVSVADTIKFTVIMEDGNVPNMRYTWTLFLPNGRILDAYLSTDPELYWVVDTSPGDYTGSVAANDTTIAGSIDSEEFAFSVDQ